MAKELGSVTQIQLQDPVFASVLWKLTPASMAVRLSGGQYKTWNYIQLLSRKLVDVAVGRCPRLIVVCPPRHGKELSNKSPILLPNGVTKLLGEIEVGDHVVTCEARGREVLAVFEHPQKPCVKITTKTGRSEIFGLTHTMMSSVGWIKAGELKIGQGLATLRHFEASRPSERAEREFRLAGYIVGDGCVTSGSKIAVTDAVELVDVLDCGSIVSEGVKGYPENGSVTFSAMRPWLRDAELLGKGAFTKVVPPWVFEGSNRQISHFLAGYFATDGAVNDPAIKRKTGERAGGLIGAAFEYCSVSRELLEGTQHLLSRFDITSNLRPKLGKYKGKDHHSWRLIISDRRSLLNFIDTIAPNVHHSFKGERLRAWAKLFLELPSRSRNITIEETEEIRTSTLTYAKLCAKYNVTEHMVWNIQKGIGKNLPHSEKYFYDEIVKLEACTEDCRCLTVDEDETFIANDFVVHNSETVSKWFPAWYLENYQDKRIILCSYEAEFASKWGGLVRNIVADNQELLTMRFKSKNPAMHFWETTLDGAMMCAGVGGPITGRGADILILDDPVKNAEEANSRVIREKTWDWYTSTARTRLEPNGAIIIMATRWNTEDLIGKVLQKEKENIERRAEGDMRAEIEGWEVFCFPAEAEPDAERHYRQYGVKVNDLRETAMDKRSIRDMVTDGQWRDILGRKLGEPLCPDRYDNRDLNQFKSTNSRDWFAMYQQRPGDEADDGNVYHAFDERRHCRPIVRDERLQLFVSMDFNVDPMCVVIGQYDHGHGVRQMEHCDILEELILPNSNTQAMMGRLLMELKKYKYGYTLEVEVYGDAAGTQRSTNSPKTNWQIVREHFGLDNTIHYRFIRKKTNPMIADRVNAVNTLFKAADGTVRLYINDVMCPELVKDLKKVKWQTDSGGNSSGLLDKSDKKRTHVSDAAGYAIEYLFGLRVRAGGKRGMLQ